MNKRKYVGPLGTEKILKLIHENAKKKEDNMNELNETDVKSMWEDVLDPSPKIIISTLPNTDITVSERSEIGEVVGDVITLTTDSDGKAVFKGSEIDKKYTITVGDKSAIIIPNTNKTNVTIGDTVHVDGGTQFIPNLTITPNVHKIVVDISAIRGSNKQYSILNWTNLETGDHTNGFIDSNIPSSNIISEFPFIDKNGDIMIKLGTSPLCSFELLPTNRYYQKSILITEQILTDMNNGDKTLTLYIDESDRIR